MAELERARLKFESEIGGVNTSRSPTWRRNSRQAQYYLDNTTLTAPEDGRIIDLQVRPGMVSGIYRVGGIAALIAEADRYVLATFYQQNLQIRAARSSAWRSRCNLLSRADLQPARSTASGAANGVGQYLPSDDVPKFQQPRPDTPEGQYAVKIILDEPDQSKFPIGAQGSAAIYTTGERGAWAVLRKISIRAHAWASWFYVAAERGIVLAAPASAQQAPASAAGQSVIYLNQAWSQEDREWYYHFSQGSAVLSYDIYLNLEVAGSQDLFRSDANSERYGLIPQTRESASNPDGLPIGISKTTVATPDQGLAGRRLRRRNLCGLPRRGAEVQGQAHSH